MSEHFAARTQSSYDRVADEYAERIAGELDGKPLDRALLRLLAEQAAPLGPICDLGCGPGHVAHYLAQCGAAVCGIDLSPAMVASAQRRYPQIAFAVGNMVSLEWPDDSFGGIAALYSIIHVPPDRLAQAFREMRRVLRPGGRALVAFHIGDETVHLDEWWGRQVELDFHFLQPAAIAAQIAEAQLAVDSITTRATYPDVEHQSQRAYIFARKAGA